MLLKISFHTDHLFLKKPPCEHTPYYSDKNHWCWREIQWWSASICDPKVKSSWLSPCQPFWMYWLAGLPKRSSPQRSRRELSNDILHWFFFFKKRSLFVLLVDLEVLIFIWNFQFFSFHTLLISNYGKKKKDITSALHSSNLVVLFLTFSWIPNASLFSILFSFTCLQVLTFSSLLWFCSNNKGHFTYSSIWFLVLVSIQKGRARPASTTLPVPSYQTYDCS